MTGRPRLNAFDWQSPAGVTDLTKIISPVDDDGDQLSRRDNQPIR